MHLFDLTQAISIFSSNSPHLKVIGHLAHPFRALDTTLVVAYATQTNVAIL
jgi:hypothetical protein